MSIREEAQATWDALQKQLPEDMVTNLNAGWNDIVAGKVKSECVNVGQKAPDFSLFSAANKTVSLKDELTRGPVVLTFYRGIWCPFCNLALQTYQRALGQIKAYGASLIAISPQTPDNTLSMKEKNALEFEVLSDPGSKVATQYKLAFKMPPTHIKVLGQFDMALTKINGDDLNLIPLPATYVIRRDGIIAWAHIDPNYRTRAEVDDLLATLGKLNK